jgi:hypothetical protein
MRVPKASAIAAIASVGNVFSVAYVHDTHRQFLELLLCQFFGIVRLIRKLKDHDSSCVNSSGTSIAKTYDHPMGYGRSAQAQTLAKMTRSFRSLVLGERDDPAAMWATSRTDWHTSSSISSIVKLGCRMTMAATSLPRAVAMAIIASDAPNPFPPAIICNSVARRLIFAPLSKLTG